jgi:hypothetical protein
MNDPGENDRLGAHGNHLSGDHVLGAKEFPHFDGCVGVQKALAQKVLFRPDRVQSASLHTIQAGGSCKAYQGVLVDKSKQRGFAVRPPYAEGCEGRDGTLLCGERKANFLVEL